jgi:hypothetical protein
MCGRMSVKAISFPVTNGDKAMSDKRHIWVVTSQGFEKPPLVERYVLAGEEHDRKGFPVFVRGKRKYIPVTFYGPQVCENEAEMLTWVTMRVELCRKYGELILSNAIQMERNGPQVEDVRDEA